jgi:hypothetical protein
VDKPIVTRNGDGESNLMIEELAVALAKATKSNGKVDADCNQTDHNSGNFIVQIWGCA